MGQVLSILAIVLAAYTMSKEKKGVSDGQSSDKRLTGSTKLVVWITCLFNPIIAGGIYYYGWKKKLPAMAKQSNHIALGAFLIVIVLMLLYVFLVPVEQLPAEQVQG